MEENKTTINWRKFILEFLSIFIAVISAFALNNWNENRRDANTQEKILLEIKNGLAKDLEDMEINVRGHKGGVDACKLLRNAIINKPFNQDSIPLCFMQLFRDFTSLQNISGYETLKSQGLEIIENDSLRTKLISLYEYDYYTLRKLEEDYEEMQFHKSYYKEMNQILAPYYIFDERGNIKKLKTPINLSIKEKNIALSSLLKIQINRMFVLGFYDKIEKNVKGLSKEIEKEL